jgi:ATP adenylyltransferase
MQPAERLWTPWRMAYVGGETAAPGCVFCNARDEQDDARNLILHRGHSAYVMMNLYPYNTGHLMVVPNEHQDDLARLRPETRAEIAELTASCCTGMRLALRCDGFNTGMNLGAVAGAGIADHLHQHIVPRWRGDANFMPIVGSTKVLPELIPATYAKLRADVARQKSGADEVTVVPIAADGLHVALVAGRLPRIRLERNTTAWADATPRLLAWFASLSLIGWAGPAATTKDSIALPAFAVSVTLRRGADQIDVVSVATALETLTDGDHRALAACVERGFVMVSQQE